VRIVVAAVLAAAADPVLVAHHLPKLGAHLVTARPVEEVIGDFSRVPLKIKAKQMFVVL
jgi:hypothetical protein